jgi:hypothetical protein
MKRWWWVVINSIVLWTGIGCVHFSVGWDSLWFLGVLLVTGAMISQSEYGEWRERNKKDEDEY